MNQVATDAKQIFLEAVEHYAPDEWAGYLDRACSDDLELRRRVEGLLTAHRQANSLLDGNQISLTAAAGSIAEQPGTVVGPYKLLEQIGEGGMGLVFMADQLRPVRRRVALKVLKPGMDTRQVIARFEAERQVLALMDHSNIAHVYDAGTTESGRPYFVMELVPGVPITEYCDEHRLDTRERLKLFATVCHAVQHAHQKGIIHRDLKPTNVLVTKNDTAAVPKVIDFGIAKATGQQLTERTLFTQVAQMIGTPLYMSPEQAAMNCLDVDTRSDVYSLGVLLYELLTGCTPFAGEAFRQAGLDEMRRIIREEEPPRPSHRISTLAADVHSTISERRGADPRQFSQTLRGELDWVVMKAIEKDRIRRYESASAFAADIERFLSNEPVDACPPSAIYRLRKFARRNRVIIGMASLITFSLMTATVVSAGQAIRAREAQRQAETERDRAENSERQAKSDRERAHHAEQRATTEAAIARAVNDFLQNDLLKQAASTPGSAVELSSGPYLTVKEALQRAADRIDERFQDQPVVEAAIRMAIGTAYNHLHEYQAALPHLERAFTLRKDHVGYNHPDTNDSMRTLATACSWVGEHQRAIALFQRVLKDSELRLGTDHPDSLACLASLAGAYLFAGQIEASADLMEQLLERRRTISGVEHSETLGAMQQLAWAYALIGRVDDSMVLLEKVLALRVSLHATNIGTMLSYAQVCQMAGNLKQADKVLREALEQVQNQVDSVSKREQMANTRGWLALNLLLQERYVEAEPFAREAVAVFEKQQTESVRRFYWLSVLGAVLVGQARYDEAGPLLLEAYGGLRLRVAEHPAVRRKIRDACEWIIWLYEVTEQREKARLWREELSSHKL
jgi:serine/threonine protein kinase/tetratricopeptide (TPR) repeat protein